MIFLRYESFRGYLKSYPVTSSVAGLCVLYFFFLFFKGDLADREFVYQYGAFFTHPTVDPFGFSEPWRYLTSIFMHASPSHLFQNMVMFIIFAPPLERVMKSSRYLIFYLLCGIGANFLSACINDMLGEAHLAVGASGAIYGLFGAYLFLVIFRKKWLDPASIKTIYIIVGIGLVYSIFLANIDFWGHIGGLVTGFILYRLFDRIQVARQQA